MLQPAPRLIWYSACFALGAAAGAWLRPAPGIARLNPTGAPRTTGFAPASAGLADAAAAPASRTGPTAAAPEQSSGDASREDYAGESVRDAVAEGPWRAYGETTQRTTAATPVPQTLPSAHRRASRGGGMEAANSEPGVRDFRTSRASLARDSAGRRLRTGAKAGAAFSPDKASRRMADGPRRARSGRKEIRPAGTYGNSDAAGAGRAHSHRPRQKMNTALGRGARTGAGTEHKIKAAPKPNTKHKAKAALKPKAEPKARATAKAKALKPPRLRPVLLSKVLGLDAIRPPKSQLKVPDFSRLVRDMPKSDPEGRPVSLSPAAAPTLEALRPPVEAAADCHQPGRHWHPGSEPLYHEGQGWGLQHDGGWLWLKKSGKNWWAWTAPHEPTWLWHGGHWWWRSDGVWFMLHDGDVWGYRLFGERRAEGLIHPGTGTQMEYSADGKRVAMITPGDGAWLFDARSGAVLQRWTEAQMPVRPKPHAPSALPPLP